MESGETSKGKEGVTSEKNNGKPGLALSSSTSMSSMQDEDLLQPSLFICQMPVFSMLLW